MGLWREGGRNGDSEGLPGGGWLVVGGDAEGRVGRGELSSAVGASLAVRLAPTKAGPRGARDLRWLPLRSPPAHIYLVLSCAAAMVPAFTPLLPLGTPRLRQVARAECQLWLLLRQQWVPQALISHPSHSCRNGCEISTVPPS